MLDDTPRQTSSLSSLCVASSPSIIAEGGGRRDGWGRVEETGKEGRREREKGVSRRGKKMRREEGGGKGSFPRNRKKM